jgi:hypothetical protein
MFFREIPPSLSLGPISLSILAYLAIQSKAMFSSLEDLSFTLTAYSDADWAMILVIVGRLVAVVFLWGIIPLPGVIRSRPQLPDLQPNLSIDA